MKRLTLDKTWELCLKQWRWIIKQRKKHSTKNINVLKGMWLEKHKFNLVVSGCFFCGYCVTHEGWNSSSSSSGGCLICPGKKIDKTFDCQCLDYHFFYKPEKFYKKLLELNRKRKKRKT